jgi:hypothetical protein
MVEFSEAERADLAERDRRYRERKAQTPAEDDFEGAARIAYQAGDLVFQCSVEVLKQEAEAVALTGAFARQATKDSTDLLNRVCGQGWEVVAADFVFVQTSEQSRNKFVKTGQDTAIAGSVIGYYVFRRFESNRTSSE